MKLLGDISVVILYVQDMGAQVAFYRDVLGFKVISPKRKKDFGDVFWVELDAGACTLALHGGGKRRFGKDAPTPGFRVKDAVATRGKLIKPGVKVTDIREIGHGVKVFEVTDPEGNKLSVSSGG